jgi:hypothetical protein
VKDQARGQPGKGMRRDIVNTPEHFFIKKNIMLYAFSCVNDKDLTPIECRIKSRSDYTDFRSGFYIFYY